MSLAVHSVERRSAQISVGRPATLWLEHSRQRLALSVTLKRRLECAASWVSSGDKKGATFAFAILRIMEPHGLDADHTTLQGVAVEVGDLYSGAQANQPSWFFMDGYKKELLREVRKPSG